MGILLVNVQQMLFIQTYADKPIAIGPEDTGVWAHWWLLDSLFDLKFFTLFTFLFGFSFVLQKDGILTGGGNLNRIYSRRLILLAVFGVIHAIYFYYADVLFMYALAGFTLLACHNFTAAKLFKTGLVLTGISVMLIFALEGLDQLSKLVLLICIFVFVATAVLLRLKPVLNFSAYLAIILLSCLSLMYLQSAPVQIANDQYVHDQANAYESYSVGSIYQKTNGLTPTWPPESMEAISNNLSEVEKNTIEVLIFRHGPQQLIQSLRLDKFLSLSVIGFVLYFYWRIAGLFFLSAALASYGLHNIKDSQWQRLRTLFFIAGLLLTLWASGLEASLIKAGGATLPLATLTHEVSALLIAAGILSQFYLWRSSAFISGIGAYLASGGRMALTNYISQSVIMAWVAGPLGLQLFGKVSHWQAFILALSVFLVLVFASHLWLRYFSMGPLEWLWRCGTYMRWFSLIKDDSQKKKH